MLKKVKTQWVEDLFNWKIDELKTTCWIIVKELFEELLEELFKELLKNRWRLKTKDKKSDEKKLI